MQMPQDGEQLEEALATPRGTRAALPSDMSVVEIELLELNARLGRVSVELPAAIESMNTGGFIHLYVANSL